MFSAPPSLTELPLLLTHVAFHNEDARWSDIHKPVFIITDRGTLIGIDLACTQICYLLNEIHLVFN
ncbi:hypothetical protein [uncultured Nonlabens sp.]|uniref:hypothetical protein n=1 Tax=uncultured Nonlabens sp. TaxID=859306 RepID=UPI0030DB429E